jgi:hypothetical protein
MLVAEAAAAELRFLRPRVPDGFVLGFGHNLLPALLHYTAASAAEAIMTGPILNASAEQQPPMRASASLARAHAVHDRAPLPQASGESSV